MWDLLKQLTAYQPSKRLSAKAALQHAAFGTGIIGRLNKLLSSVGNATDQVQPNPKLVYLPSGQNKASL